MDPIGASCFSLHIQENEKAILEQQKQDEKFTEIIVSCRSLSKYEARTFKSLLPQIIATMIAGSYHIVVGISLAYSAILIPQLNATGTDIEITKNEASWIASVIVVVVPVGAILAGFFMDWVGRLNTVKLAAIPGVIGWTLIATATNVPMIIAGRILTGLATTWGSSPAVVYITEIARADMRGSLISCAPAYASLGMVIAYLKGWFLNWRTVAWYCNAYSIIPCLLIWFLPESPAWLVSKGKIEEASKSLKWINKYQPQPPNQNESLAELQLNQLQKEHQQKLEDQARNGDGGLVKIKAFLKPTAYKPLIILFGLFFFQQFSGIYITLFYSVSFFQEVGSTINPYLASVLIGAVRFFMSMVNTYMLKTFRRRPLVMTSAVGMTACMAISGLFTSWILSGKSDQRWVPVALLLLYVITSMIGLLPIPWTMTAELFPIEIRGVAHSIAYSIANLLMFASVQSYYALSDLFGGSSGVQYFFAVISICGMVYTFIFLPETHGKKLTEITDYFNHNTVFLGQKKPKSKKKTQSRVGKKDIVKSKIDNTKLMQV
ncbi:unnamed protein product [Brassicogethes aeneus]|uniref:Major facilitator superfamily (MFS) profile domain-containing protein n=1 Tax=Brassicogethes aeneus TaxID=1431903 RepID=A0A9P0AUS2_BRAAE|nr:unnamed protein product [Brassicogethes aeneus]